MMQSPLGFTIIRWWSSSLAWQINHRIFLQFNISFSSHISDRKSWYREDTSMVWQPYHLPQVCILVQKAGTYKRSNSKWLVSDYERWMWIVPKKMLLEHSQTKWNLLGGSLMKLKPACLLQYYTRAFHS